MRIVNFGIGYIGLVSGICLINFRYEMFYVDNDIIKISILNSGEVTCVV